MKLHVFFVTAAFVVLRGITPAVAEPCVDELCLAGAAKGENGGPGCIAPEEEYFDIRIESVGVFDSVATRIARNAFIHTCPDPANEDAKVLIDQVDGSLFSGP